MVLWGWVSQNWMQIIVSAIAIDKFLIPLFPNSQLLVKIYNILTSIEPKSGS